MQVNATTPLPRVEVSAHGPDLTSRAGTVLLSALADRLGLTEGLTKALRVHTRRVRHAPGANAAVDHIAVLEFALARLPEGAWLEFVLIGSDLLAWTRRLLLAGTKLASCEPKRLRYRLLHVAGRIVRHARGVRLRFSPSWPWAEVLAAAFVRLKAPSSG